MVVWKGALEHNPGELLPSPFRCCLVELLRRLHPHIIATARRAVTKQYAYLIAEQQLLSVVYQLILVLYGPAKPAPRV